MAHMVCFLSGVSLMPETAWVFNHGAALAEKRRLKARLDLLDKLVLQYDTKDAASADDIQLAQRRGRRVPLQSHRLVSEVSAQAISHEFAKLKLFIPWNERLAYLKNLRFRHLMEDASCNQRLKDMPAAHARAALELGERLVHRLDGATPLPLSTRKKVQTLVCVDFFVGHTAPTIEHVLQSLWSLCTDDVSRKSNQVVKHWKFEAQDWDHMLAALKRLVQAGGWAAIADQGVGA